MPLSCPPKARASDHLEALPRCPQALPPQMKGCDHRDVLTQSLTCFPRRPPVSPSSCLVSFPLAASLVAGSQKMDSLSPLVPHGVPHGQQVLMCLCVQIRTHLPPWKLVRLLRAAGSSEVDKQHQASVCRAAETWEI